MVKVNASHHIRKPLIVGTKVPKTSITNLPSSSPLKSFRNKLLLCSEATKRVVNENEQISIHLNSSFSSSPIKKLPPPTNPFRGSNKYEETEHDSCDLDLSQLNSCNPQKSTQSINFDCKSRFQQRSYIIDESVSTFLNRFNNDGVLDLGLEEISYGGDSHPLSPQVASASKNPAIKYHISYYHNKMETIIEISSCEQHKVFNLKKRILSELHQALVLSQKGARKYKVVILTPRPGASWFERKLQSYPMQFHGDLQYIIVNVRKSFAQKVKDCLKTIS